MSTFPRLVVLAAMLALLGLPSTALASHAPRNDDFGNATVISTLPFSARVDVSAATRSATDPGPYCFSGPTIWYAFTSPYAQMVKASTAGSDYSAGFEVYRQTQTGLQLVTCGYNPSFEVQFQVDSGVSYYFNVGPSDVPAPAGSLQFNLSSLGVPPVNDTRSGAIDITTGTTYGDSTAATGDAEDSDPCNIGGSSLWYRFVAPSDARYRVSTSPFITNVKEVTDTGLVGLACAQGSPAFFELTAGHTYYIVVGSYSWGGGPFALTFEESPAINPVLTVNPKVLLSRNGDVTVTGTIQCGKPANAYFGFRLNQRSAFAEGQAAVACDTTVQTWTATGHSAGNLVAGPAQILMSGGAAYSSDGDYAAIPDVNQAVRLALR